ncbi:MAG: protein-L-isoaspartate(D-aspartate) O-methyltransferase [Flavobacteriales bacterium]|nr:protein-L-isoaspartate(D-aspartate) O-methyltransferase [Flavobacteriales bacterium]
MTDSFKQKGMRRKMIDRLRTRGIFDEPLLEAFDRIPRHIFLGDNAFDEHAYEEKAFHIGAGQTISNPFTVAFQTQLLEIKKGEKVLEIGTGCGYQTAILCQLGAKVFSIERQRELFDKAKITLNQLNFSPRLFYGDGFKGQPAFAPYDKIIVTCGAPFVPQDLVDQLKTGGIMVIPVGETEQDMIYIIKNADGSLETRDLGKFKFVPMLEEKQRSNEKLFFRKP